MITTVWNSVYNITKLTIRLMFKTHVFSHHFYFYTMSVYLLTWTVNTKLSLKDIFW